MEGPSHEPYFIVLTLWEQIIIEPMKKLVTTYVVRDLVLQIISLSVDKWEESCIGLTQENSRENSVQDLSTLYTKAPGPC